MCVYAIAYIHTNMYIRYSYAQICNIVTAIVFSNFSSHFRMANVFVNTEHAWHVYISMRMRILFMSTLFTNISFRQTIQIHWCWCWCWYQWCEATQMHEYVYKIKHKLLWPYIWNLNAISIPIRDVCYCISFSILIVAFNFIECSISEFDTAFDTNFD